MKKEINKDNVKTKIRTKKTNIVKEKKNYFEIAFIFISILLFFVLVLSIYFLKDALYSAKDQVAQEYVSDYEANKTEEGIDPFVTTSGDVSEGINIPVDNGQDPALGSDQAKVKIFYFSDMSCTFCFQQEEIIKKVYDKFNNDVRIIWKDYPELNILQDFSYQAARAIRCANDQGRFWDYKQMLHQNEKDFANLGAQLFFNVADNLKLNIDNFGICLNSDRTDRMILKNIQEAENLGVMGVPYIYINGLEMISDFSEEELENLIENEIEK